MTDNLLLVLLPNILVVLGWYVLFRQAVYIKDREYLKDITDKCSETVDEIFNQSTIYFGDNRTHIGFLSADIKAKFVLLSHYLSLLKDAGIDTNLGSYVNAYKKQVTGFYFETTDFKKQSKIPNWNVEVASTANELKFRMQSDYFAWLKKNKGLFGKSL